MQEGAGPEWDHIDQLTLEEVEKSWAHSRCGEVEFGISGRSYNDLVSMCVCQYRITREITGEGSLVAGLPYDPTTDIESV